MKIPRRNFIGGTIAGLGAALFDYSRAAEVPQEQLAAFDPYEMVPLGKTGLTVSRVGFGTGMNGSNHASNQTRLGKEKFSALIKGCYDRGVRFFDMADLYGTHPYVLEALKGVKREELTLCTKLWYNRGGIPTPLEERPDADKMIELFLKQIGTDYLDLVLLHCMTKGDWTTALEKQMTLMDQMKKKGVIRAHGVSIHSLAALKTAASEPWVDSVHARINPYGEAMDGTPQEVLPVLQQMRQAGKGVVGMKIIGAGKFRDSDLQRNHSIDFVLNCGCVDMVIVGFESLEETDDFAARVRNTPRRNKPVTS
ncbi:MAG: aldo/keto reductase [Planctomycetaceae bacterium]|nr:aldo/keto reductase [Planctomycetaceae bacterium]